MRRGLDTADVVALIREGILAKEEVHRVIPPRTLALCVLETIVHLPSIRILQGFIATRIEVPDDARVEVVTSAELPDDPFAEDAAAWFRRRGDRWLETGAALALVAPSVICRRSRTSC